MKTWLQSENNIDMFRKGIITSFYKIVKYLGDDKIQFPHFIKTQNTDEVK